MGSHGCPEYLHTTRSCLPGCYKQERRDQRQVSSVNTAPSSFRYHPLVSAAGLVGVQPEMKFCSLEIVWGWRQIHLIKQPDLLQDEINFALGRSGGS